MPGSRSHVRIAALAAAAGLALAGCATESAEDRPLSPELDDQEAAENPAPLGDDPEPAALATLRRDLVGLGDIVEQWSQAEDLEAAQTAAEIAANLVTGPDGPGYGDRDGDGEIEGQVRLGLLPGVTGEPEGSALPAADEAPPCVRRDVLGGSWEDPQARWAEFEDVVSSWTEADNTMPMLDSHLMRVAGWAALTQQTGDLDQAREFASHAELHVDIALRAIDACEQP